MGKSRNNNGNRNGALSSVNQETYNQLSSSITNPTVKQQLDIILDFCNENGLELQVGKKTVVTGELPSGLTPVDAMVTIYDPKTGKHINIFEDMMVDDTITKVNYDNLLNALRDIQKNTSSSFFNLAGDINITKHRPFKWANEEFLLTGENDGFFDPYLPSSINISGQFRHNWDDPTTSTKNLARVMVHEMAHNYDFNVIGGGQGQGKPSLFTQYGKDGPLKSDGSLERVNPGPTLYSDYNNHEVIAVMAEMVYDKHVRDDAYIPGGIWPSKYETLVQNYPDLVQETERILRTEW